MFPFHFAKFFLIHNMLSLWEHVKMIMFLLFLQVASAASSNSSVFSLNFRLFIKKNIKHVVVVMYIAK